MTENSRMPVSPVSWRSGATGDASPRPRRHASVGPCRARWCPEPASVPPRKVRAMMIVRYRPAALGTRPWWLRRDSPCPRPGAPLCPTAGNPGGGARGPGVDVPAAVWHRQTAREAARWRSGSRDVEVPSSARPEADGVPQAGTCMTSQPAVFAGRHLRDARMLFESGRIGAGSKS